MVIPINAKYREVTFHVEAEPGSDVYIAGTFNHWNGDAKRMVDPYGKGSYYITLTLPEGIYEYKFIINGEWQPDRNCPKRIRNAYGSFNNLIEV